MSQQKTYKGIIEEMFSSCNDLKEIIRLTEKRYKIKFNKDDLEENYIDEDTGFFISNQRLFRIIKKEEISGDIFECQFKYYDQYSFLVSYYNGGCSFSEAIEKSLNRIK